MTVHTNIDQIINCNTHYKVL